MWAYVLAGATYVFMALWLVAMWRLRRATGQDSRDRNLSFSVGTGALSILSGVTAIAILL